MDSFSGGVGNDTFSGLVGVSGTFSLGDTIVGGAGTDTLNLLVQSGGQSQLVTLSGVENVNARLLEAGPASALALNAIDWAGVTTLSFNNSLDETAIRVSGITTSTTINVNNEVDVSVDFRALTSATDTVNLVLTTAGSGGGTAASLTSAGVADINLDLDGVGLIDAVNISLTGKNYAVIEAGADNKSIKFTGNGGGVFSTDDEITSLDASALTSGIDFTFSGASEVSILGGGGNDTFRMRAALNAYDTINGGDGTDAVTFTVAGSTLKSTITNVESATATFGQAAGGRIDATSMSMTSYEIKVSAAGSDGAIINLDSGVTVKLADGNLDDLEIDTKAAASTITINVGSAGTSVSVGDLTITDVTTLNINAVGSGNGASANTIDALIVNSAVKNINLAAGPGEAELLLSSATAAAAGLTTLTVTANGSAGVVVQTTDSAAFGAANAINSVSVFASGTGATATMPDMFASGTALASVSVGGTAGGDISIGDIALGARTAQSTVTYSVSAGQDSDILVSGIVGTGRDIVLNLDSQATGSINFGTVSVGVDGSASAATITVGATVQGSGVVAVSAISLSGSATLTISPIVVAQSGGFYLGGSASADNTNIISFFKTGGTNVGTGRVSDINITLGTGASSILGAIAMSASGTIGNISASLSNGASAFFNTMGSAASIGDVTMNIAGNDAGVRMEGFSGSSMGAVTVNISGTGNFTVGGSGVSGDFGLSQRIGDITVSVATGAAVSLPEFSGSAIGNILVSGAGSFTMANGASGVSATTVAGIDTTHMVSGGAFTINLKGVTTGVTMSLGAGTNTITTSKGGDTVYLASAAGTDKLAYFYTGTQADEIYKFEAGTSRDTILLGATALDLVDGAGDRVVATTDGIAGATAAGVTLISGTAAASTAVGANENIIVVTYTSFANAAAVLADIGSGGQTEITLASGCSAANLVLVWSDGSDTHITLVSASAGQVNIDDDATYQDIAILHGITASSLVTSNFAIYNLA